MSEHADEVGQALILTSWLGLVMLVMLLVVNWCVRMPKAASGPISIEELYSLTTACRFTRPRQRGASELLSGTLDPSPRRGGGRSFRQVRSPRSAARPMGFALALSCLPRVSATTFTTTASLRTAVQAYDANATSAIATYGPIANWDVAAITNMAQLFKGLANFNADISAWNTTGVTDMSDMFSVRSETCPAPDP